MYNKMFANLLGFTGTQAFQEYAIRNVRNYANNFKPMMMTTYT